MGGASLAIVEKKPQFGAGAGGCAGGVLFHLLDWHRRLARKRRLFSPRRLLPAAVRSSSSTSTRRLPPPPPSPALQPPRPAPSTPDGPAAPGVVARLMGLDHWPSAAAPAAGPRPQKQRKVEAASAGDTVSEVVVVVPQTRRTPAHAHTPRSHHSVDLPARSPRRTRFVHAAAARLLEPSGGRASSRGRLAYACSSPQHRGHAGGTLEDFLARSDSPAPPPPDAERGNAVSSRWQQTQRSVDTMSSTAAAAAAAGVEMSGGSDTIVVPRAGFGDANTSINMSDEDALHKDCRARNGEMGSCARVRSSSASGGSARTGEQRLLCKRGTFSRPDVPRSVGSGNLASLTRSIGNARELAPGGSSRRTANNSGPMRESMSSITLPRSNRRDLIDRNGSASTSRNVISNASGPRRGSTHKKVDRGTSGSNNSRGDRNAAAFATSSSMRPVSRTSSLGKVSEKREFQGRQSETSSTRMPVADAKCLEAEHCVVGATSEKEEFSRLLKAKIDELGLSDKVEPSESHSANLTVSLLQELISALTDDTNTSASQSINGSDSSAPLNNAETVCNSSDQSSEFHNLYQFQGDQEAVFSVTCTNEETNQPSPTSVLEACFSNDASSLGSPVEKNEGKEFFVSMENKMEDLFNLESDIVDLAMSVDSTKTDAHGGSGEMPCVESIAAHDFKFLECRLHNIGEAISNAELLLDGSLFCGTPSSLSLHSFIVEMLETVEGFCCGGLESLGFKEENRYQRTNFLFDCIVESLDSKFRNFGKCGYEAWLRLPLTLSKDLLQREVSEEIVSWMDTTGGNPSSRDAEKELDQVAARWDACRVEAFNISVAIEDDILEALVGEFAFDQC